MKYKSIILKCWFVKLKSGKQNDYSRNGSDVVGYADPKSCKNYIKR